MADGVIEYRSDDFVFIGVIGDETFSMESMLTLRQDMGLDSGHLILHGGTGVVVLRREVDPGPSPSYGEVSMYPGMVPCCEMSVSTDGREHHRECQLHRRFQD